MKTQVAIKGILMAAAIALALASPAQARIKLVAVPERDAAVMRLDSDANKLVEERRTLTLTKGSNFVDFSWEGVVIDAGSLLLTPLDHPDQTRVIGIDFPPNVYNSLVWEIYSDRDGEERVSISYLIFNVNREIHYEAKANKAETAIDLRLYAQVFNDSGEDYDAARFRQGFGKDIENGIESGEAKKLLVQEWANAPVEKIYRLEAGAEKADMYYRLTNDAAHGLGDFALPAGKARIYQGDGKQSDLFLGEDNSGVVPVGAKVDLQLAVAEDIKAERFVMSDQRENVRNDDSGRAASFDRRMKVKYELENFKNEKATLEIVEHFNDCWELVSASQKSEKKDASTLQFTVELPKGGEKAILEFEILWRNQVAGNMR